MISTAKTTRSLNVPRAVGFQVRKAGVEAQGLRKRACRQPDATWPEEWSLYLGPDLAYRRSCPERPAAAGES